MRSMTFAWKCLSSTLDFNPIKLSFLGPQALFCYISKLWCCGIFYIVSRIWGLKFFSNFGLYCRDAIIICFLRSKSFQLLRWTEIKWGRLCASLEMTIAVNLVNWVQKDYYLFRSLQRAVSLTLVVKLEPQTFKIRVDMITSLGFSNDLCEACWV